MIKTFWKGTKYPSRDGRKEKKWEESKRIKNKAWVEMMQQFKKKVKITTKHKK